MKLRYLNLLFIMLILLSKSVSAVSFIGLEWGANNDWRPNLVIGTKQNDNKDFDPDKTSSKVTGWGSSISFGWDGVDRIKIFKISGVSYLQAEVGFGYSIVNEVPFFNFGVQTKGLSGSGIDLLNNLTADIDLMFDGDQIGHLGFNNMGSYK